MNNVYNNSSRDKKHLTLFLKRKILTIFLTTNLVLVSGISNADDTEIFRGVIDGAADSVDQNPDFFPNVLFILDNSTSMGETEPVLDRIVSTVAVDPTGGTAVCDVNLTTYDPDDDYSFGSATDDSDIYIYRSNVFTGNVVTEEQNQCNAYVEEIVNGNLNPPVFTSQLIQWGTSPGSTNTYSWDSTIANFDTDDASGVECAADRGIHGHKTRNTGDTNPRNRNANRFDSDIGEHYFRNRNIGNDPYANAENVSWLPGNYHRFLQLQQLGSAGLPAVCTGAAPDPDVVVTVPVDPFDSSLPLGTVNNPELATDITAICGGSALDRDAFTGRSQAVINGVLEQFKNRYFQIADSSNSDLINVYRCQTRLDIMKEALTNVLEGQERINAGLMRFNANNGETGTNGGTVISAVLPMNEDANRQTLIQKVDDLEFANATPLAESLYEAYRYFRGLSIDQGRRTNGSWDRDHASFDIDFLNLQLRERTDFQTDPRARDGNNYVSPIRTQCQDNNVVLLSDGEPSNDTNRNGSIQGLAGGNCSSCSDEIAGFMKNNDIAAATSINSGVNTFTIGLNLDSQTLRDIADAGGPDGAVSNFAVTDTAGLEAAFRSILGQIDSTDADVFSAPAVTVNAFNRLENREDLYFALFRPENSTRWAGNVKKYRVTTDPDNPIVDANDNDAIDDEDDEGDAEGFFFETAQSFWSSGVDGAVVDEGGAGEQITFARRMFGRVGNADVALSSPNPDNAVTEFLTATDSINIGEIFTQGQSLAENRERIAQWTLGLDIDGERESTGPNTSNQYVGDNLHGTPYVISFGADENDPLDVVFYTSNQGILHAIDGDTGQELWSYIPDISLYQNLGLFYNNQGVDKLYGLDGEIAFKLVRDPDTPNIEIDSASLFFGQRRGGDKVISVDVTNARVTGIQSPVEHRWVIEGPSEGNPTPGYERLGQTWAEPVVADVNYCDFSDDCEQVNTRSVVFVSGGYDDFYDDVNVDIDDAPSNNVLGNAVYMADANTGELLWMVGGAVANAQRDLVIPEMVHSVVSPPTAIDSDGNGFIDTLFFTDISGQIFRVDFRTAEFDTDDIMFDDNSLNDDVDVDGDGVGDESYDDVSGGRIANLQETDVNRRFYNPLSVTVLQGVFDDTGALIAPVRYAIATSSGYRAHPLLQEPFENRVYVAYDKNINTPQSDEEFRPDEDANDIANPDYFYQGDVGNLLPLPAPAPSASPRLIGSSDLLGIDVLGAASDITDVSLSTSPPEYQGYFINLPEGSEKSLNPIVIADFQLLTVTYVPSENNASNLSATCEAGLGNSRLYSFNLINGETRLIGLRSPGISPAPVIVYLINDPGTAVDPVVIVGTEPVKINLPGDNNNDGLNLNSLDLGKANKAGWWESGRIR